MLKVIVFDMGGTLMEYEGMPYSWVDYYYEGLSTLNQKYKLSLSDSVIQNSVEVLKSFNPRVNYREIEYTPEYIFSQVIKNWQYSGSIDKIVYSFYEGLKLKPVIYKETIPALIKLKQRGYKIAILTDLPTAMPDELFRKDIEELLQYCDLYVSSLSCGYRKPNPHGLEYIAKEFMVPVEDLVFVGDEEKDKKTASNAGCDFVKIVRHNQEKQELYTLCDLIKNLS